VSTRSTKPESTKVYPKRYVRGGYEPRWYFLRSTEYLTGRRLQELRAGEEVELLEDAGQAQKVRYTDVLKHKTEGWLSKDLLLSGKPEVPS
jgi:hypothetical protein